MAKQFHYNWFRRLINGVMHFFVRRGQGPARMHLLSVTGRKSGNEYTVPVNLVRRDGSRYIVSPYGQRSWVKNARASGEVRLNRGKASEVVKIEEMAPADSVGVLAQYWQENSITRPFFAAAPDAGGAFAEDAPNHPVFRIV